MNRWKSTLTCSYCLKIFKDPIELPMLDIHNHFQETRFKLDEHREELKMKIDNIYMIMIYKTKKLEATYLKNFKEKLEASLESFETKSLEQSLKEIEESFRNPNLP